MDRIEKLIKRYLKSEIGLDKADKTPGCPDEQALSEYLNRTLSEEKYRYIENHIAGCGFCLSQLDIASQAQLMDKQQSFGSVPRELIDKTKASINTYRDANNSKINKLRKKGSIFFLLGAVLSFGLSFIFPKYFMQFLVVTLILGVRWAFESKNGRTMIMVFNSWRNHSHDKDEEISHRLKNHF